MTASTKNREPSAVQTFTGEQAAKRVRKSPGREVLTAAVQAPAAPKADFNPDLNHHKQDDLIAQEVAEEIDTTGVAKDGKVIFKGNVVSREDAARIVDERLLAGRKSALFDLQDVIEDNLPCNQVRLRLRSNLLWSLSYRIVGAVRDVLFRMNEHARETGTIAGWNEFYAQLSEAKSSTEYAEQMGYTGYSSGIGKVHALLGLYQVWREHTIKDAHQLRAKIDTPELIDLVSEPPQYDPSEANKMVLITRLMLEGESPEVIEEAVKLTLAKCQEDHKQKVLNTVAMAPHMERVLTECAVGAPDRLEFFNLPIELQGSIIDSALRTVKKVPQQMAKMRSVSTTDMVVAFPMIKRIEVKLNDVLADPRFEV